jgi:hypothetical protein
VHLVGFYYKNVSRCTFLLMSKIKTYSVRKFESAAAHFVSETCNVDKNLNLGLFSINI